MEMNQATAQAVSATVSQAQIIEPVRPSENDMCSSVNRRIGYASRAAEAGDMMIWQTFAGSVSDDFAEGLMPRRAMSEFLLSAPESVLKGFLIDSDFFGVDNAKECDSFLHFLIKKKGETVAFSWMMRALKAYALRKNVWEEFLRVSTNVNANWRLRKELGLPQMISRPARATEDLSAQERATRRAAIDAKRVLRNQEKAAERAKMKGKSGGGGEGNGKSKKK